MAETKNKIFSDSDFEKEPEKKPKDWVGFLKSPKIWIVLVLIIVLVLFLCYKGCDKSSVSETSNDQTVTTQVDDNKSSVVDAENESEVTPSNETDDNADEDVASESEPKDSKSGESVAENSVVESQASTDMEKSVRQNNASSVSISGTLEEKAKAVIRGNYGNGLERKRRLGDEYAEIQSKVNEMYRNGLVK